MNELSFRIDGKDYDTMLFWNITKSCNFSCYQCVAHAEKTENKWAPEMINIKGLKKFLSTLNKSILFHITGGEPLLVKNIIDVCKEITKNHYLFFISNLVQPNVKDFINTINPDRVDVIIVSAHFKELEKRGLYDTFVANCLLLKEKKFPFVVHEVAYPDQLHTVKKYKQKFSSYGITLEYEPFRGTWTNKKYPDAYTENEIKIFKPKESLPLSWDHYKMKDKLCNAGCNIAVIENTGDIYPCYFIKTKIGNINKGIKFRKRLTKCPIKLCTCPFPVFFPAFYKIAEKKVEITRD